MGVNFNSGTDELDAASIVGFPESKGSWMCWARAVDTADSTISLATLASAGAAAEDASANNLRPMSMFPCVLP